MKKIIFIFAGLLAAVMLTLPLVSANSRDPRLKNTGLEIQYEKKAFSGIIYRFYRDYWPQHLAFVWDGKMVGAEYFWYANKAIQSVFSYKNGRRDGDWKQWYPDGSVRSLKHYVDGKLDGEYWVWHTNGVVSDYRYFEKGQLKIYKSFISDGKPFYNYVYHDGKRIGLQGGHFCKTKQEKREL